MSAPKISAALRLSLALVVVAALMHLGCSGERPQPAASDLAVKVLFPEVQPQAVAEDIRSMQALAFAKTEGGLTLEAESTAPVQPEDTTFSLALYLPPGDYILEVHALDENGVPLYSGSEDVGVIEAGDDVSVTIELFFARPLAPRQVMTASTDHLDIRLGWIDPLPQNTERYRIERALGGEADTTWAPLDSLVSSGADSVTYTDAGVPTRRPYLYRLRGENANGASPWSEPVQGILFLAAPQSLAASAAGLTQVNLTWGYPGPDPMGFSLLRAPTGDGGVAETILIPGSARAYADTGLTRGTRYSHTLRAVGFDDLLSSPSARVFTDTEDIEPICTVSGDYNFGEAVLGTPVVRVFTITNTGGMVLEGNITLDECLGFSIDGEGAFSLEFQQSRQFTVTFDPPEIGPYQCEVQLGTACGAATLTGSGVGTLMCQVSAPELDFGAVKVGQSIVLPLSVTNTGSADLELTVALEDPCSDFSLIAGAGEFTIPPSVSHPVEVVFHPGAPGATACTLNLGAEACASVDLRGSGVGPICSAQDTVFFGDVPQDVVAQRSFTITNLGGGTLEGSAQETCNGFSIAQGGGAFALEADQEHEVVLAFQSTIVGPKSCPVELGAGCPPVIAVANVISAVVCEVSPSSLDFGEVEENTAAKLDVVITNTGGGLLTTTASLDCEGFSISGDAGVSAAGGQSDTVSVLFSPPAPGEYTCTLSLGPDCGSVELSGVGTQAPLCESSLAGPDSADIKVGETFDFTLVVRNAGGGFLAGAVSLMDCGEFALIGPPAYNIAAGDSAEFTVRFSPTTAGTQACTVDTGCRTFPLTGTATDFEACTVEPDTLDFGTILFLEGGETVERTFVITNTGTLPVSGSISKSCGSFSLGPGGGPFTLQPGETKEMKVVYEPTSVGEHTCTVLTGLSCGDVFAMGAATTEAICQVTNQSMDFGLIGMGMNDQDTFSIFNNGGSPLTGTVAFDFADPEFSILSGAGEFHLEGGEQLDVIVEFAPALSDEPGEKSFSITVSPDCPPVTGVGRSAFCEVVPNPGNFGTRAVDSMNYKTFTLRNISAMALSGTIDDTGCAPFYLDLGALAAVLPFDLPQEGDFVEFDVLFNPAAPGDFSCELDLDSCGVLPLTGSAPLCDVSPAQLDFYIANGNSEVLGVTIWNNGGGVITVEPSITCVEPGADIPYISSGGNLVNLINGQSHTVLITFSPESEYVYYECDLNLGSFCSPVPITATTPYIGSPPPEAKD